MPRWKKWGESQVLKETLKWWEKKRVCVSVTRTHLKTPHTALDSNRPSVAEPEEQFGDRGAAAGEEEDRDSRGQHTERKSRRKRRREEDKQVISVRTVTFKQQQTL